MRSTCAISASSSRLSSLACAAGLNTWLCFTRGIVIVLFNHSVFGRAALVVAALNLLRPSLVLLAVALALACLRHRALQHRAVGAGVRPAGAQPGASRTRARVNASAASAAHRPQRLPVRKTFVERDVDTDSARMRRRRFGGAARSRSAAASAGCATETARPPRSAARTGNRGSADRTPDRARPRSPAASLRSAERR